MPSVYEFDLYFYKMLLSAITTHPLLFALNINVLKCTLTGLKMQYTQKIFTFEFNTFVGT